jgi:aconitate hydratase
MADKYLKSLDLDGKKYRYYDIESFAGKNLEKVPYSLRVLLENMMRYQKRMGFDETILEAICDRENKIEKPAEIPFHPTRVLMQDFTGVPAIVDLAALRNAVADAKQDPSMINPHVPVDVIIDHSVQVDSFGEDFSLEENVKMEYERNHERYSLLKWAQKAFTNLRIVPPNSGICHQVNLEYLADCVHNDNMLLYPDSLVGTDSHTTMINGLGVMGWGVGGIEAEAVMLGQPYFMPIPTVVGVKLTGKMANNCTATDLVLTLTNLLRKMGVVGSFVEYFGPGLLSLELPDRATIANMSPEYGATMGFFPVDERTLEYLNLTAREEDAKITEAYCKANNLFHDPNKEAVYDRILELDLSSVVPSIAGPARPQDRIDLAKADIAIKANSSIGTKAPVEIDLNGQKVELKDGSVAIAAITSCTNTSNPFVMIAAGQLAKKAVERGLKIAPWVKTSLAPGSQVVKDYLENTGLLTYLEKLGFNIVAYGCTTCIGNSGPLHPAIEEAQKKYDLTLASVLSGNRNFEGRIHKNVKASFLMSPPLVVAYALAGKVDIDLSSEPLAFDANGEAVYLNELWPDSKETSALAHRYVTHKSFVEKYRNIFDGDKKWQELYAPEGDTYHWDKNSTYIAKAPFFENFSEDLPTIESVKEAYPLLVMGDSVTTDHISPAGSIDSSYPSGLYLKSRGVEVEMFNSYGSRRGNHNVMVRGTFGNTRIKQKLSAPKEGGYTKKLPEGELQFVFDAAMAYQKEGRDLIVLAGKEYGTGSSRDWAAKGARLLGIKAVLSQSFERIHRSNLVGMGVLPLTFKEGDSIDSLNLTGEETFSIEIPAKIEPKADLEVKYTTKEGLKKSFNVTCRLDSPIEVTYYENGGILHYVLRKMLYN